MGPLSVSVLMVFVALLEKVPPVWSHGRLMSPPSRSSMWRFGFDTPTNWNDNELFCGGLSRQKRNGMRCGLCGDPWDKPVPRDNELGGLYGKGIISGKYKTGSIMTALVELTANHKGFFEFKLCPVNGNAALETEDCLQQYPLEVIGEGRQPDRSPYQYVVPRPQTGMFDIRLRIPDNMVCSQCVFQWSYTAGNNWGVCENGTQAVGCGPQETFRGCADIEIDSNPGESSPVPAVVPPQPSAQRPPRPVTDDRFVRPYRPHYHSPNRKPNHSPIPHPHRRRPPPPPPPTHRPLYTPPTTSWEHWNSANAWPNSVNPGYPHGKPSTTTWFYHQWPPTARPFSNSHDAWPSTPDLKTSPRPFYASPNWAVERPHYVYPNRRPSFHPTPAYHSVTRLNLSTTHTTPRPRFTPPTLRLPEQEEWPSTPDLKASPRPHSVRRPPQRKWNPEMDDFPNEVFAPVETTSRVPVSEFSSTTESPSTEPSRPAPTTRPISTTSQHIRTTIRPSPSSNQPTRPSSGQCYAAGRYTSMPGMDQWCMDNCNHIPPFCPPSHCKCD